MATADATVDLAHSPEFRLGRLIVRPPLRQLIRDDGAQQVLEPRVMQVLLALVRADGGIVTRDELTSACWQGRIVGDDAINRVISRLRRTADGIGVGSFQIETLTKVGYRLVTEQVDQPLSIIPAVPPEPRQPSRRLLLTGGAATLAGAGMLGSLLVAKYGRRASSTPSAAVAKLMEAGLGGIRQTTGEGDLQARGLLRRVTEIAPEYAPGWGALAFLYAMQSHHHAPDEVDALRARARNAAARALALDPADSFARAARVVLQPLNRWLAVERGLRRCLGDDPRNDILLQALGRALARVGRMGEAADMLERAVASQEASPLNMFDLMSWQWSAGRLDDADKTISRAISLFPRNFAVWFGSFYIRIYTGRIPEALDMARDPDRRPANVSDEEIETVLATAVALQGHDPAVRARLARFWLGRAREGAGYAENALQFLVGFGRLEDAFAVADAYFLDRGWSVPSIRFPRGQGSYTYLPDRRTNYLFQPSVRPMWNDRRFTALTAALGLDAYWREVGVEPDFRRL